MFSTIPQNRLILYIALAAFIPVLLIFFFFNSSFALRNRVENELTAALFRAKNFELRQAVNLAVKKQFLEADHFYIDKNLETLTLLKPEIELLQQLTKGRHLAENEAINKRIEFLTGKSNKLAFSEGVVQSYPYFKETTETLIHPVEININDLHEILSLIEGVKIEPFEPLPDRPQLIILDFKLDKKNVSPNNQVFSLNLKLLKREYL